MVQTRQEEVKDSIRNVEANKLICVTHGYELRVWGMMMGGKVRAGGNKGVNNGTTLVA